MRAHTIITLYTEVDIFVLCQASNVWIEYTVALIQIRCYARNLSPIENSIGDGKIWTQDLLNASLKRYQLSCPDWILVKFFVLRFVIVFLAADLLSALTGRWSDKLFAHLVTDPVILVQNLAGEKFLLTKNVFLEWQPCHSSMMVFALPEQFTVDFASVNSEIC